jgi:hypothetical protein
MRQRWGTTISESQVRTASISWQNQCFGSGSVLDLSLGSGSAFQMGIRIQQLIKLAPKAKENSFHLVLFD